MMTGLYIVFSRGNLVKTIVGLNLFQTSVFIFYITISKVSGGTAPILIGGYGDDYGGGYGDDHANGAYGDDVQHGTGDPDHDAPGAMSPEEAEAYIEGDRANALEPNEPGAVAGPDLVEGSLHDMPELGVSNSLLTPTPPPDVAERETPMPAETTPDITVQVPETAPDNLLDAPAPVAETVGEILYSNPLPHVLILTAIVVGVATTAVGLAIAVRIREAYGTIEEDTLERMDNAAAYGSKTAEGRAP
jgi:multicomponent Na+:H+ antiporter subunit C